MNVLWLLSIHNSKKYTKSGATKSITLFNFLGRNIDIYIFIVCLQAFEVGMLAANGSYHVTLHEGDRYVCVTCHYEGRVVAEKRVFIFPRNDLTRYFFAAQIVK